MSGTPAYEQQIHLDFPQLLFSPHLHFIDQDPFADPCHLNGDRCVSHHQHGDEHQITADVDESSKEDRCPIDVDGSV